MYLTINKYFVITKYIKSMPFKIIGNTISSNMNTLETLITKLCRVWVKLQSFRKLEMRK